MGILLAAINAPYKMDLNSNDIKQCRQLFLDHIAIKLSSTDGESRGRYSLFQPLRNIFGNSSRFLAHFL